MGTTNTFGSLQGLTKQVYPESAPKEATQGHKFKRVQKILRGCKKDCSCKECK